MPGEPRDVAAKPFNSSTVVVRWAAPADDKQNGVIRAYQIYIQPRNTVSQSPVASTLIGPKSPEAWLIAGGRCNAHFIGVDAACKGLVAALAFAVTAVEDIFGPVVASQTLATGLLRYPFISM